jgi:hypothetical protein
LWRTALFDPRKNTIIPPRLGNEYSSNIKGNLAPLEVYRFDRTENRLPLCTALIKIAAIAMRGVLLVLGKSCSIATTTSSTTTTAQAAESCVKRMDEAA